MSRKMSKSVCFSPDINEKQPTSHNHGCTGTKIGGNRKRVIRIWSFRLGQKSGFSPVGFLRRIGSKFASVFRLESIRRRSSRKVSSSSLARSRSYADNIDSQRAEAIEECIEFFNSSSSSSLQRSNSASANSNC